MCKEPFNLEKFMAGQPAVTRGGMLNYFVAYVPEAVPSSRLVVRNEAGRVRAIYESGALSQYDDSFADLTHMAPPYADFKIDEPVMVRGSGDWRRRHFAGVSEYGYPLTWAEGTRWASKGKTFLWHEARRPTPEELEGGE